MLDTGIDETGMELTGIELTGMLEKGIALWFAIELTGVSARSIELTGTPAISSERTVLEPEVHSASPSQRTGSIELTGTAPRATACRLELRSAVARRSTSARVIDERIASPFGRSSTFPIVTVCFGASSYFVPARSSSHEIDDTGIELTGIDENGIPLIVMLENGIDDTGIELKGEP